MKFTRAPHRGTTLVSFSCAPPLPPLASLERNGKEAGGRRQFPTSSILRKNLPGRVFLSAGMARGKPGSGQPALVGAPPPRLQKDRRAAGKGPDPSPPSSLPKQERSPDSVRCAPRGAIPSISSLSFRSPAPERGHPLPGARLALFFLFRRTLQGRSQAVLKAHASPSQPMIQASLLRRGKEGRAARLSDLPSGRDRQGQISEERFQCGNGWRRELLKGRGGTRRKATEYNRHRCLQISLLHLNTIRGWRGGEPRVRDELEGEGPSVFTTASLGFFLACSLEILKISPSVIESRQREAG
uniref:dual specificity protein phosphatase 22 isoform X2 n=1 Tax=Podarcis muralis TaxID=64176 RepID=UPI00109FD7B0|nr:dual specificity protein phosphatase 22 isoform X2 [Podarcis muralis]